MIVCDNTCPGCFEVMDVDTEVVVCVVYVYEPSIVSFDGHNSPAGECGATSLGG